MAPTIITTSLIRSDSCLPVLISYQQVLERKQNSETVLVWLTQRYTVHTK